MVKVTLSIGAKGGSYDVPVRRGCLGVFVCYQVMVRNEKIDVDSIPQYELGRKLYNTEQVLFNICNILAVAATALIVLRHFSLSLTTVLMTASFWVARELILQDVSAFEKEPFRYVVEGHNKVDPEWKANIELGKMVFLRRILPPVAKDKINEISMAFDQAVEQAKNEASELIREGAQRLEKAAGAGAGRLQQLIGDGAEVLQEGLYPTA